jgi:hypothetical protein
MVRVSIRIREDASHFDVSVQTQEHPLGCGHRGGSRSGVRYKVSRRPARTLDRTESFGRRDPLGMQNARSYLKPPDEGL